MNQRLPRQPRMMRRLSPLLALVSLVMAASASADNNFHLIESLPNGFAIYRSGKPDRDEVAAYCDRGITEIAVLAGNADEAERRYAEACPTLDVVYDVKQDAEEPVSDEFLEWFDSWVESARRDGKKIAFRCNCGCHRTGRLAAYYQMKYMNLSLEDALLIMYERGRNWARHRSIEPQVRALRDYMNEEPCSQDPEHCVRSTVALDVPRSPGDE
jgi:hypothetical protein